MIVCEGTLPITSMLSSRVLSEVVGPHRDGSRGIVAFHFPGELFGWSNDPIHALSAEAAAETLVLFSNAALCLPPPCETAELQRICWPPQQMSFDASKSIRFC